MKTISQSRSHIVFFICMESGGRGDLNKHSSNSHSLFGTSSRYHSPTLVHSYSLVVNMPSHVEIDVEMIFLVHVHAPEAPVVRVQVFRSLFPSPSLQDVPPPSAVLSQTVALVFLHDPDLARYPCEPSHLILEDPEAMPTKMASAPLQEHQDSHVGC